MIFKESLDNSKESYYLTDNLQLSISKLSPYLRIANLSKKDFNNLNKLFRKFSKNYLREHSLFRKTFLFPIKGTLHRIQFKLYSNIWDYLYLIFKYNMIFIILLIVLVPIYLIFVLRVASWLYQFFSLI